MLYGGQQENFVKGIIRLELPLLEKIQRVPDGARFPHVPMGIKEFLENVWASDKEYPASTECWRCKATLSLKDVPYNWPIGYYDFYAGRVPAYRCGPCGETYFPRGVLDAIGELIEREEELLPSPPPFVNPDRILPSKV